MAKETQFKAQVRSRSLQLHRCDPGNVYHHFGRDPMQPKVTFELCWHPGEIRVDGVACLQGNVVLWRQDLTFPILLPSSDVLIVDLSGLVLI